MLLILYVRTVYIRIFGTCYLVPTFIRIMCINKMALHVTRRPPYLLRRKSCKNNVTSCCRRCERREPVNKPLTARPCVFIFTFTIHSPPITANLFKNGVNVIGIFRNRPAAAFLSIRVYLTLVCLPAVYSYIYIYIYIYYI